MRGCTATTLHFSKWDIVQQQPCLLQVRYCAITTLRFSKMRDCTATTPHFSKWEIVLQQPCVSANGIFVHWGIRKCEKQSEPRCTPRPRCTTPVIHLICRCTLRSTPLVQFSWVYYRCIPLWYTWQTLKFSVNFSRYTLVRCSTPEVQLLDFVIFHEYTCSTIPLGIL